ncbi:dystrotelin [Thomomys bottae]
MFDQNASPGKQRKLQGLSYHLPSQDICEMGPGKQSALNSIENSVYRTAFKLRSVQTLCQLDLMDSSQIQQVLLRPRFPESRECSLSVHQLFKELQELFQKVKVGKPGQVHPRAPELTLSLLMAMYDSTGSGFLKLLPVAAALIVLSGDSPLTKSRALFQLYAHNNKKGYDSGPRMTRRILRNLLMDIQQIPTVVGEHRSLCSVDSAIHSCFRGVFSPGIKEEKFLSWMQSEPLILLWLPTCHRLSATEQDTHPARCSVCRDFPITGLRYRCRKCLHFDICQVCFVSGLHSKSHQTSHPVTEHRLQQMSPKENTKLLLKTLRNNLFPGHSWRKEATRRQWWLDPVMPKDVSNHAQARLSIQYNSFQVPEYGRASGSVKAVDSEACVSLRQRKPRAPQADNSNRSPQDIVSIKKGLWRTGEPIPALQRETRLLQKQLKRYKDKLRVMYSLQEERSCRFETKIHELRTNQDSLRTTLQQMEQELQVQMWVCIEPRLVLHCNIPSIIILCVDGVWIPVQVPTAVFAVDFVPEYSQLHPRVIQRVCHRLLEDLKNSKVCGPHFNMEHISRFYLRLWLPVQPASACPPDRSLRALLLPLHPSSSCQNIMCETSSSTSNWTWKGGESSQIKKASEGSPKWEPRPKTAEIDKNHRSQANAESELPNAEPPEKTAQSTRAQSHPQKMPEETQSFLSGCQKERLQISPAEMGTAALAPEERKAIVSTRERDNEQEGEELQELLSKLLDAFHPETTAETQTSVNMDLYGGAERVCKAFSAFVDQITLPNLK